MAEFETHRIFGTRSKSGTCWEHVRNAALIDVMCRAWDINVSYYICEESNYESSFLGLVVIVLGQVFGSSRQNCCLYPPKSDRCPDRFMPDVTLSLSFI